MTRPAEPAEHTPAGVMAQGEGPAGGVVAMVMEDVVPSHLLDEGEVVHFAIKPSLWFVPLVSLRWIGTAILLACLARADWVAEWSWYLYRAAFWLTVLRLGWGALQWVSRLYVLTNRRVMRIRGVFRVELFECPLHRIQNTSLSLAPAERVTRVGTILFETAAAAGGGAASWRMIARPLEIHEQLRDAIRRAQSCGRNGL